MKKLLFVIISALLLVVCAVSASAAEATLEKMEITQLPTKVIYNPADAVERTESVWNDATQAATTVKYNYYPIDFRGLEITFTYDDATTDVFRFDEVLSLVGDKYSIKNETVQNAKNQWEAGKIYTVSLSCGELSVEYQVSVTTLIVQPESEIVGCSIVVLPEKRIYLESEGIDATAFDENKQLVHYKEYAVVTDGMLLQLTYKDGSIAYCTPEMLPALTGEKLIVVDDQTHKTAWQLGKNEVTIVCGTFSESITVYLDVKDHKIDEYTYADHDTHKGTCEYCEQTLTFDCAGGEATCSEKAVCASCEHAYGETEPHTLSYAQADTGHTETCSVCDYEKTDVPHEFTAGDYDLENKQALYTCSVCAYSVFGQPVGDIDGNGAVTAADAREALRASVGLTTLTAQQEKLADVDGSGSVDAGDARSILRASVDLEKLDAFVPVASSEDENE